MSQYINSFLIEPVVRQARRFSRSSHDTGLEGRTTSSPTDTEVPSALDSAIQNEEPGPTLAMSDLTLDNRRSSVGNGETVVAAQDSVERVSTEARTRNQDATIATNATEGTEFQSTNRSSAYTFRGESEMSFNPQYGVSQLRSSSASMHNSTLDNWRFPSSSAELQAAEDGLGNSTPFNMPVIGRRRSEQSTLPADDGMSYMRKRILSIHRSARSNEEKARLVHRLMTEKFNASQPARRGSSVLRASSPASMRSSGRPRTPSTLKSTDSLRQTSSPPTSSGSNSESTNLFNLTSEDLKPTYFIRSSPISKERDSERISTDLEEEAQAFGCKHYKRNIKLQCSACFRWYTCRFCHDAVENHMLNRRETKNMLCMQCSTAQSASGECTACGERSAWYYCDVCKLWDDDTQKSIYHCNDCGICRVGQGLGKDFFHCKV